MKFLKLKIIISVYLCLVGLALYTIINTYITDKQDAKDKVFAELKIVVNLASIQINGNQHQKLTSTYLTKDDILTNFQDQNYLEIHNQIKKIQIASKKENPIYTLIKSKDNTLLFGVTSAEQPYYLHPYHTAPKKLLQKLNIGANLDEYEDENGTWLSAFSPIKTTKGEVVGIVQVDENFNEFINGLNKELRENIFFNVFIYSIIGIFLFAFLQEVLNNEENHNKTQLNYKIQLENEVKTRTKELMISNDQLKKVNMQIESFFYSASHDIRGPLSRILGLSYLAKIDENYEEILDMIEIESQKMDKMLIKMIVVNNLRTCEIKIETIKTKDIIDDVLFSIKDNFKDKQVHLKIECNNSVDFFNTDQEMLKAILTNAIDNSFKFSDINEPKVFIKASINQDQILHIAIGNNGKTFSDIEKQNAFDIFKRAHKLGDTDTIRLGLYTIKTCIDKLNGIVEINNQDGLTYLNILIPDANLTQKITQDLLQIPIS